jgi:hypothetical protein
MSQKEEEGIMGGGREGEQESKGRQEGVREESMCI